VQVERVIIKTMAIREKQAGILPYREKKKKRGGEKGERKTTACMILQPHIRWEGKFQEQDKRSSI